MNNYHAGHFAEKVVLWFLRLKGYRLVAINHQTGKGTKAGEIDIIVRKGQTIIFVEVKKRKDCATAAYSVLLSQQQRIRRAAEVFVARHREYHDFNMRFDVVLIGKCWQILHIQNAF